MWAGFRLFGFGAAAFAAGTFPYVTGEAIIGGLRIARV